MRRRSNMSMRFESKPAGKNKNTGFYVAIGLCCAAVCLVAASSAINRHAVGKPAKQESLAAADESAWTIDEALDATNDQTDEVYFVESDTSTAQPVEDDPEITAYTAAEQTTTTAPAVVEASIEPSDENDAPQVVAAVSYAAPLDGSVTKGFSGTELVFCATMGDWRVHSGVDIAGEAGGEVRAAADGIVSDFIDDMLYGYTAIVTQSDGSMMYYCGLTGEQKVSSGLEVKTGDLIGYLGEVPCEAGEGAHLHLALMKDGAFVDPASVMSIG